MALAPIGMLDWTARPIPAASGTPVADKFEDLRTYVAIVENGGINAAAASLVVAKSAVSRRLGELEARLGVTLIARTTRSFELTALGRDYHRRAKAILASLAELDEGLVGGSTCTVIRIAVDRDVPIATALQGVAAFQTTSDPPGIEILISEKDGADDADVRLVSAGDRASEAREIASFRWLMVAAPSYLETHGAPKKPSDLKMHRGIGIASARDTSSSGRSAPRPRDLVTVPEIESALGAAIAGIGMARLPSFVVRPYIDDGRLLVILGDPSGAPSSIFASYRANAGLEVKRLVDCLAVHGPRAD